MIYIWLRTQIDWEDAEGFLAQTDPRFRPKVELWNRTFNMPYHRFRQRLRSIAERNHARVEGAVPARWEDIPDGSLVAPVDDDDWFAPDLGPTVEREFRPYTAGLRWRSTFIERPIHLRHRLGLIRERVIPSTPPKFVCTTNNYVLVKRPGVELIMRNHVEASWWVEERPDAVPRIDRRLSAMNRTLGSQTTLGVPKHSSLSRRQLLRKARAYRRLYRRLDLSGFEWASPYVAMMADLMEEVRPRD